MKWATRPRCHIDRTACAWLIRRFIDPDATFVFADSPRDVPPDATAFDMPGVPLSHHRGDCTFETLLRRNQLSDPALWKLAELVHEGDLADDRYDAPEALGLDVLIRALSHAHDDHELLALTEIMFDALYLHHGGSPRPR